MDYFRKAEDLNQTQKQEYFKVAGDLELTSNQYYKTAGDIDLTATENQNYYEEEIFDNTEDIIDSYGTMIITTAQLQKMINKGYIITSQEYIAPDLVAVEFEYEKTKERGR